MFWIAVAVTLELLVLRSAGAQNTVQDVRLVGGRSHTEGIVEIFVNKKWATVTSSTWGKNESQVVCRQLFGTRFFKAHGSRLTLLSFGQSPRYYSSLVCNGSETGLGQCSLSGQQQGYNSVCCAVQCASKADTLEVVLRGGNSPREGRVELMYNGYWGTICADNGWNERSAKVLCRQLGLKFDLAVSLTSAVYGAPTDYSTIVSNLQCTGNEDTIEECSHNGWLAPTFCSAAAGLACLQTSGTVRLADGNNTDGYLQIMIDNQWVYVMQYTWTDKLATVVCRQLGMSCGAMGQKWNYPSYYTNRGLPIISTINFVCTGQETGLTACVQGQQPYQTSVYAQQISCRIGSDLDAYLVDGTSTSGRLEVVFNGQRGTVCASSQSVLTGSRLGDVVCRQLNISYDFAYVSTNLFGPGVLKYVVSSLNCNGFEQSLGCCSFTSGVLQACYKYDTVTVNCFKETDFKVRLFNGTVDGEGTVQIYINNGWKYIKTSGWGQEEAIVVCRQLGLYSSAYPPVATYFNNSGSISYAMTYVYCTGSESNLGYCSYYAHYEDYLQYSSYNQAGVKCTFNEYIPVQLVDSSLPRQGRVQVFFGGKWEYICDSGCLGVETVVCKQLGFSSGLKATFSSNAFSTAITSNVRCYGNESSIGSCSHTYWGSTSCYTNQLGVQCGGQTNITSRLVGGGTTFGYVQLYVDNQWYYLDSLWGNNNAQVICRQLGITFYTAIATSTSIYDTISNGTQLLTDSIQCRGDESNIGNCVYNSLKVTTSYAYNSVAGVQCLQYQGAWTVWGEWSPCSSLQCTDASQSRTRYCMITNDVVGSDQCLGKVVDTRTCNEVACQWRNALISILVIAAVAIAVTVLVIKFRVVDRIRRRSQSPQQPLSLERATTSALEAKEANAQIETKRIEEPVSDPSTYELEYNNNGFDTSPTDDVYEIPSDMSPVTRPLPAIPGLAAADSKKPTVPPKGSAQTRYVKPPGMQTKPEQGGKEEAYQPLRR